MAKPDIYSYITLCNRKGGEELLKKAGYPKPKNPKEMADMLAHFVTESGKDALIELAKIHPDKELILNSISPKEEKPIQQVKSADGEDDNYSNCSGCAMAAALAADGTEKPVKKGLSDKTINIMIISGAAVLAMSLVTLIVYSNTKK